MRVKHRSLGESLGPHRVVHALNVERAQFRKLQEADRGDDVQPDEIGVSLKCATFQASGPNAARLFGQAVLEEATDGEAPRLEASSGV